MTSLYYFEIFGAGISVLGADAGQLIGADTSGAAEEAR